MQYQVRTGPVVNDQAPFSPEMIQGSMPSRSRVLLGARIPLPIAQTTHVEAPFIVAMSAGWQPPTSRALLGARIPLPISQVHLPAAPLSVEMSAGYQPPRPRLYYPPKFEQEQTPDIALFSIEMAQGYGPSVPRILLGPRIGQPISQPTHVQAAFSSEMVAGTQGIAWPSPRIHYGSRIPLPSTPFFDAEFSIDMVAGSKPDSPRLFTGQRFAQLQVPEVTAFSPEMVQGWHPDRPVILLGPRIGQPITQTTPILVLSPEMTAGALPLFIRRRPVRSELFSVPQVDSFSIEMVQGYHADSPRIFKPHAGLSISQTTHVSAPIGIEMLAGYHPDTPVLFYSKRFQQWQLISAAAAMSIMLDTSTSIDLPNTTSIDGLPNTTRKL